jgi:two-component system, NtrC family, response regulator HydG
MEDTTRITPSAPNAAASGPAAVPAAAGARVLVVDDEVAIRRSVARILGAKGFDVLTAEDGEAALSLLNTTSVDVVLADLVMPRVDGMELLARLRDRHPEVEVIMMTAHSSVDAAIKAVRAGAYNFLSKPFPSNDVVLLAVAKAAEHKLLVSETRDLKRQLEQKDGFGDLVGTSAPMRAVYDMARSVSSSGATVLLLGESGTGKELVARAIHQHGPRRKAPFVAINCGAIPENLIESELFGHAKGAFSGAIAARSGLFESADKGTVFLDEVGELPLAAQVKLLRTLQEGEIKRVGANETRTVDVRIVAATHRDLKELVAAGRFREDLYYRLSVIPIQLPPLRLRRDDIPILAYHFLRKYARRSGRDVHDIGVEAMRVLRDHNWPGNVRELENCMERAVVLARGGTLAPADLPADILPPGDGGAAFDGAAPMSGAWSPGLPLPEGWSRLPYAEAKEHLLRAFHDAYLKELLRRTEGNVSEAARQAGLDRSNFRRLLKRPLGSEP